MNNNEVKRILWDEDGIVRSGFGVIEEKTCWLNDEDAGYEDGKIEFNSEEMKELNVRYENK